VNENIPLDIGNSAKIPSEVNYPKMNLVQRILGVIFAPGKVMKSLEQKPRILFALLLTIITPIGMIFSVLPMYKESLMANRSAYVATYEKMGIAMTPEQIDNTINRSANTAPFTMALMTVGMWFLGALILWLVLKIFKGKSSYKQMLSVTGYAAVISTLASIAVIITTLITGVFSNISFTSLASLLPDMKGSFLYGAAKALDIFSIWQYVVIAIGAATVSKVEKKSKVYIVVACIFAIIVIYTGVMEVQAAGIM
jgi:hypothetical protein